MPPINEYKCNKCDLTFPSGWGGYMYVEVDKDFLETRYNEISTQLNEIKRAIDFVLRKKIELKGMIDEVVKTLEDRLERELKALREILDKAGIRVEDHVKSNLSQIHFELERILSGILSRFTEALEEEMRKLEESRQYIGQLKEELNRTGKDYMRIECPHPGEEETVRLILGENCPSEVRKARTGFNSYCICLDCLHQFEADLRDEKVNEWRFWYGFPSFKEAFRGSEPPKMKDERKCPRCGSTNVKTVFELVGKHCPKCKKGIIVEIETGKIC